MAPGPGVTYICIENTASNVDTCMVCHYNDGDLDNHIKQATVARPADTYNYYGYVSDPLDDTSRLLVHHDGKNKRIEGTFCEALLRPAKARPNAIFVRWMINPEAAGLEPGFGVGFPVGWAVRGYLPEELARRNDERKTRGEDPLPNNEMNILPVFRADFGILGAIGPTAAADQTLDQRLIRMYYITNQEKYQVLKPKTLEVQVRAAKAAANPLSTDDDPMDIVQAKQTVLTQKEPQEDSQSNLKKRGALERAEA